MTVPVIDIDAGTIHRPAGRQPVKEEPRIVTHNPGCIVHQHSHTHAPWRCSARFWCASCRVWFGGGRCFPDRNRW